MVCPFRIGDLYDGGVITAVYQLKGTWRAKLELVGKFDDGLVLRRDVELLLHKFKYVPPPIDEPKRGRKS